MSRGPDLSAFPIPRKGGARPIELDETPVASAPAEPPAAAAPVPLPPQAPPPRGTGQLVATTVKLDEDRYLRLAEAGRPAPGRLRRRTIQDIMVEALDEWLARRGL